MNNRHGLLSRFLLPLMLLLSSVNSYAKNMVEQKVALSHAHAHNDYWHDRPLRDALACGFTSVEADVLLQNGNLYVGHDPSELTEERTLEKLYLEPLKQKIVQNGGHVHAADGRFFLLVDIKSDRQATNECLQSILSQYEEILTTIANQTVKKGPVTVVITGNMPSVPFSPASKQYAGVDGRLSDLDSELTSHTIPMVSERWSNIFTWRGIGPIPLEELQRLQKIVDKSHARSRVVRFWATPENEEVWKVLLNVGVDLINTDELKRLETFLRST